MIIKFSGAQLILACCCWFAVYGTSQATDIKGNWANDKSICNKLFQKKGSKVSFVKNADLIGSGFIVEGNRIRGKMAVCNIKLRKEEGAMLNIAAACSTDVAVETVLFAIKIVNEDKIVRTFPGLPELDTAYERCPS